MGTDDSSMEFDLYENARRNLRRHLEAGGHDALEAERVALYVIQGIRCTPKLLTLLDDDSIPSEKIEAALRDVLDAHNFLDKARAILREPRH